MAKCNVLLSCRNACDRNTRGVRSGLALAGRLDYTGKEMLPKCANHNNYEVAKDDWLAIRNRCWLGWGMAQGLLNAD
jgi:hypothetical protein